MPVFTEEQVEEMVREAVSKTEKSFGGTFKRLKGENEELKGALETSSTGFESAKQEFENRIGSLEEQLAVSKKRISELAITGELEHQLRITGPLPENFIDRAGIEFSEDPETLSTNVSTAIERGRRSLETVLKDIGVPVTPDGSPGNPTNPPRRDTKTAQDLKNAGTKEALGDMVRRGLLR